MALTDQQKKEFDAVIGTFGQHKEQLLAQAVALENMPQHHFRSAGKHFHSAVKELDRGVLELEQLFAEEANKP